MFLPLHDTNALNHVRIQFVTLGLIAVNILVWIIWSTPAITSPDAVHAVYISFGYIPAVINGYEELPQVYVVLPEQASFVTYAFFHSGFMHLAGNMLFLWVFGDNVEDAMGHFKFLLFYFACAAGGAFVHGLINPDSVAPLIGASGAAAGVISAYLILHPRVKIWVLMFGQIPLRIPALWVIGAWISFQVFQLISSSEGEVSWGAHVGGIIVGAILVLFMRRKGVKLFDQNIEGKLVAKPAISQRFDNGDTESKSKAEPALTRANARRWGRGGRAD